MLHLVPGGGLVVYVPFSTREGWEEGSLGVSKWLR